MCGTKMTHLWSRIGWLGYSKLEQQEEINKDPNMIDDKQWEELQKEGWKKGINTSYTKEVFHRGGYSISVYFARF